MIREVEIVEKTKWVTRPIGDVLDVVTGNTPSKREVANEGDYLPFIKPPELQNELIGEASESLSELGAKAARVVPAGSVLISCIGNLGRVGLTDRPIAFNQQINAVKPHPELEPKYLFYYFQGPSFHHALEAASTATTVALVNKGNFIKLPLSYPPLPEQRRIVSAIETQLGRLDAAVARLHAAKAKLKRYKQAVLKAAVEGELVELEVRVSRGSKFQHASELLKIKDDDSEGQKRRAGRMWGSGHVPVLTDEERDRLPEGWAWTKVRALGYSPEDAVQVGPMSMKSEDFRDDGTPVLNVGCVKWGEFDETKLNYLPEAKASEFDRYRIKQGDVLFTRSGTVGRCAVAQAHQDGWLMTFHLLRARTNPKKCLPDYLRTVFEGAPHILRQTKDASIGSTRAGFNTNLLAELDVPLPPMREQMRIVAAVEQSMERVREMEATLDAQLLQSTRLRQAVLKRAFEGRLV